MKYRILALSALFVSAGAFADAHTGNLDVSAEVEDECVFDAGELAFGTYSPLSGTAHDVAGTIDVTCAADTSFAVRLGAGANADGSNRRMVHGSKATEYLGYQLFRDSGREDVWGIDGTDALTGQNGAGIAGQTIDVYGRIPAAQDVDVGLYSDTVLVTLVF